MLAYRKAADEGRALSFDKLKWTLLLRGVGLHHGMLQTNYKEAVQHFFRRGQLRLVVATSGLAQGINMPCRSVVFAGDAHYLDSMMFRQCSGRAGRRGLDAHGTVVLLCWGDELAPCDALRQTMTGTPTRLTSQFRLTYNMM